MIDREQLLSDLQSLLSKTIEPDLRERSELPEIAAALTEEFEKAKKAERTALNYTDWRADYITQIGVGWVLSCVFIRFLEDNDLIDPPKLSGPAQGDGDSQTALHRARDEYDLYIKSNPTHSFREYILCCVDELAKLPGVSDVFGDKNVIHQQRDWLSNDAAKALYNFWQTIEPETGSLIHNFVDDSETETFDTRFLGDLYQDLSEAARKKYALLQTPDFVEEFILDRTLEPALDEFGLQPGKHSADSDQQSAKNADGRQLTADSFFKMIDPACGSGHFLLGAFPRILRRWQQKEPGTKVDVLVQRTLHSIHGVDINPFAIAIARFRLLLASLKVCGIERLRNAIDFEMSNLACGDSLYHGRQQQQTLGDWTDESHYFQTEDADNLKRILKEGTFHAVVANPPYITPKDKAANQAYRKLYPESCHMKYSLSVPFMDRIFRLAAGAESLTQSRQDAKEGRAAAGYTGQITANSFMKREFGKKLIESFFKTVDLTHVIDTSGAYIPGHGTPTTILFGRNRTPVSKTIRTVMGIRGEPSTPDDAAQGKVWTAIVEQIDQPGSESEFISAGDSERSRFEKHPWSIGGGGAAELKEKLEKTCSSTLKALSESIGFHAISGEDDAFIVPDGPKLRSRLVCRPFVVGDLVRDWNISAGDNAIVPYDFSKIDAPATLPQDTCWLTDFFWRFRSPVRSRSMFGKSVEEHGFYWYEYMQFIRERATSQYLITFAEVATHNHFVLDRGGKVFKQTAPVIKLPAEATEDDHLALLGLLNSSTACFWMKQVCHQKQMMGGDGIRIASKAKVPYAFNGTALGKMPIPLQWIEGPLRNRLLKATKQLDEISMRYGKLTALDVIRSCEINAETICAEWESAQKLRGELRSKQVYLQEEIDFICYEMFGLTETGLLSEQGHEAVEFLSEGERPFCLIDGGNEDGFPVPQHVPEQWPDDIKDLWQQRIESVRKSKPLRLIESSMYKRRWIGRQGLFNHNRTETELQDAAKKWMTDRLESYFDFDGRMQDPSHGDKNLTQSRNDAKDAGDEVQERGAFAPLRETPPLADIGLVSVATLADVAAKDPQFMEVAEVYRDRADFDLVKLVDELVCAEHVPALPILRYKPSGMDKRAAWEETWELQRAEDQIEARIRQQIDGLLEMGGKNKDKEGVFRKDLPDDSPVLEYFNVARLSESLAGAGKTAPSGKGVDARKAHSDARQQLGELSDNQIEDGFLTVDEIVRRCVTQEIGPIPVPPKYASKDMISTGGAKYWKLRGKLDVPKERWVSFPRCEGADQTLVIAWAGYDHLQLLKAIAAYFADVQERGGSDDPRLVPLLAAMDQQIPWVKQWHNEIDPDFNMRLGDYFADFINDEARNLGLTIDDIRAWQPPKKVNKKRAKKKVAGKGKEK